MDTRYKADLDIPASRVARPAERRVALRNKVQTLADVCAAAGIRLRVTGGRMPKVVVWRGPGHIVLLDNAGDRIYAVDRSALPQREPERAARVLEILAHSFHDYATRETICGRGIFVYPVTPDHGRAWLAEIGRRGGRSRSARKRAASRENGASRVQQAESHLKQ